MDSWYNLIVGTLVIAPEISVLVNIIGAVFLLEIVSNVVALLSSIKR